MSALASNPFARTRIFNVTQDGGVKPLDADENAPTIYPSGAPVSTRFSATSNPGDNFGHFRISSPPVAQASRTFANSTLQTLSPYKVRDLFQSQASRAMVSRKDVLKQTQKELYVPRTAKLLKSEDFSEFNAAANAYAATMANTTANSRAKAAARATSLAAGGTSGQAGSGGGAAATVAAATASALAAASTNAPLHLPIIPDSIDAFELGKAAATEAYLQDIWNENRSKEAADERLRKHIKKLVHEWSAKLARFEEEVQRRQEDTYYARFRREADQAAGGGTGGLSKSTNFDEEKESILHSHKSFAEDHLSHHRREAYTVVPVGKSEHKDQWALGTEALPDPKANKISKDTLKARKALLDHQMSHSICASTLAAPRDKAPLQAILSQTQGANHLGGNGVGSSSLSSHPSLAQLDPFSPDQQGQRTHLTFSPFRPTTTPAIRSSQASKGVDGQGEDELGSGSVEPTPRPQSQPGVASTTTAGGNKFPSLLSSLIPLSPGLSVRQTRPGPFSGVPGHGHPINTTTEKPHTFSGESIARTAGITKPELLHISTHARKRQELLEVERIKARLSHEEINVPRGTLERALVPPEIQFSQEQQMFDLPIPFFGLPQNPFDGIQKKKKKGGKGSKKGKKGKK